MAEGDGFEAISRGERVALRRFRESDLEDWHRHMNTAEARKHLGGVGTLEESEARFRRQAASWDEETGGWLAIERADDGTFLGYCGFGPIQTECAPDGLRGEHEIGWGLRPDCWGQGYATEAANCALKVAFERFGVETMFSQTSEANRGSWRVMERLGMERAGHLDYDDPAYPPDENPTKVYRLTRGDWQARNA